MKRRVEWAKRALKEVARLDRPTRQRLLAAIKRLAEESQGDVRPLQGAFEDLYRLRVGDWRIIFRYEDNLDNQAILVLRVRPRGGAYRE